jgi:hypothetical protein
MPTTVKIRRSGTASATPSSLEHGEIAINYADGKVFWKNASNVITSFTFQSYALASHTHSISDVTGLQTALDGKASSSHTHGNITNAGAIGSTADQFVVTTTSGVLTAVSAATARTTLAVQPTASPAFTGAATFANTGDVVPLTVTNAGTANSFVVNDASGDTTPFVIDADGNAGIGYSTPSDYGKLVVSGGTAANAPVVTIESTAFNASQGCSLDFARAGFTQKVQARLATQDNGASASNFIIFTKADGTAGALSARLTISSTGTATFSGQILADDLTTSNSVVYGFDGDTNTGVGRAGADILTFVTNGTERVRVDASGNVGIGVTPTQRLHVVRSGTGIAARFTDNSTQTLDIGVTASAGVYYDNPNSGYHEWQIGGSGKMRLTGGAELLIGTTTDNGAYLLQVNSQIYATNATIATSDARFKTRVESLTDATSVIESLRPVAFDFIPQADRNFATERQVGLIAQEAQAALAGTDYADSVVAQCGDHLGLAYEKLVPVLIRALQESNARIAALEERLSHG